MSKLLAVAARELRERWLLFPGALASGFFPLVLPAFGVKRDDSQFVGLFGAVCLAAAAAVVIGSSMLARDTANGRLGFLFSRPVSWPVIWGGKWLASLVLVVASGLLAAVPWMVAFPLSSVPGHTRDSWLRAVLDAPGSAYALTLVVLAVGLANFGATAFRSRSPWVALDLVLLLAAFWAIRRYVAPLWWFGIFVGTGSWGTMLALLPLALGLVAGSVAQVAVGRTDVRRAHRALSLGFWAVVGLTLGVAAGYWAWVRSAGPADVNVHGVTRDPAGRWAYVEGSGRHSGWYPHGFLVDTTTGRYVVSAAPRLAHLRVPLGLLFSADGRFVAQPHLDQDERGAAVSLFDLTGPTPHRTEVTLESSPPPTWATAFAFPPSATSVFMVHESGASLFALPSGRRVATTTIPPGWRPAVLRFLAEGAARAWLVPSMEAAHARARAEIRLVDLAADGQSRALTFPITRAFDPLVAWRGVVADTGGQRILTFDGGLRLRDGASGELIATLAEGEGRLSVRFLADGRIVVGSGLDGTGASLPQASLRTFDRAGAPLGEMRLDLPPGGLSVGPEVAPGRVAVSSLRASFIPADTLVVDVGEGRVVERLSGLWPATGFFWNVSAVSGDVGPTSAHFFRDVEGRVLRIDFATGERKTVAGPGAPPGERISVR